MEPSEGAIPEDIEGTFFRNGPAKYKVQQKHTGKTVIRNRRTGRFSSRTTRVPWASSLFSRTEMTHHIHEDLVQRSSNAWGSRNLNFVGTLLGLKAFSFLLELSWNFLGGVSLTAVSLCCSGGSREKKGPVVYKINTIYFLPPPRVPDDIRPFTPIDVSGAVGCRLILHIVTPSPLERCSPWSQKEEKNKRKKVLIPASQGDPKNIHGKESKKE